MIPLPVIEDCHDCGLCCESQAGLPVTYYAVLEPDAELPPELRAEIDETVARWRQPGPWTGPQDGDPCVWYDLVARRCRHHEHRPSICQEFELGGAECRTYRREGGLVA